MSEDQGYSGKALECLKKNGAKVGDSIKIIADLTYSGILMPRYESGDDMHLVVKLGSGYNVGINVDENGNATQPIFAPELELDDIEGRALMIHAGGDNYSDSPKKLGGGGDRVACGVIGK